MDTDWFQGVLQSGKIESIGVDGEPVDTAQSIGVKVVAKMENNATERIMWLKKIVAADFPPEKELFALRRDLLSNRNEALVYENFSQQLIERGVPITGALHIEKRSNEEAETEAGVRESAYLFLLQNVDDESYDQRSPLDTREAQLTLAGLAKLHAATWEDASLLPEAAKHLHARGGYWALAQRGEEEMERMREHWPVYVSAFKAFDAEWFGTGPVIALAERLCQHGPKVATTLSADAGSPFACLVHGDAKAMNMFVARRKEEGPLGPVVFIDFQWTSLGFGMLDVAMHLQHSVACGALEAGGEERLVLHYYDALRVELDSCGKGKQGQQYTWEVASEHYKLALVDYARVVLGHFFKDASPATFESRAHRVNMGLPYRNVSSSLHFVKAVEHALSSLEATWIHN